MCLARLRKLLATNAHECTRMNKFPMRLDCVHARLFAAIIQRFDRRPEIVCTSDCLDSCASVFIRGHHPTSANSATGGHEHIRLRSPYGLSILPTVGQNLRALTKGRG